MGKQVGDEICKNLLQSRQNISESSLDTASEATPQYTAIVRWLLTKAIDGGD